MRYTSKKAEPGKVGSSSITTSTVAKEEGSAVRKREQQTKVDSKKRRKEKKKSHPEITIISKNANIPRKVKADPELTDLGSRVSRIRRTQKRDLMLELNKSNEKAGIIFGAKWKIC